jgi:hypothetical protein
VSILVAAYVVMTSCSLQAVAGNITSAHSLHVHIGSKNRRGVWHTRNEAVDRSGKGDLPTFLHLLVVMNKLFKLLQVPSL